jgi:Septum formation initiator
MAKKGTRYGNFVGVFCIVASFVLLYLLGSTALRVHERKTELTTLEQQKNTLQAEKEKLKKEVSLLNDDDYVVRYAREHYIFSKDGEEVATLPETKK